MRRVSDICKVGNLTDARCQKLVKLDDVELPNRLIQLGDASEINMAQRDPSLTAGDTIRRQ